MEGWKAMKRQILDVLFSSGKRKDVILLLKDGPKEMTLLLKSLDTTRQALLPQIKVLEEHHIVEHDKDACELTTIGKMIVDEMIPLLDTIELFDNDMTYWGNHKLDFMPDLILKDIKQLAKCEIIKPSIERIYELDENVVKTSYQSKCLLKIISAFHPQYPSMFHELIEHGVNIYCIISQNLHDRLLIEHAELLEKAITSELIQIFVYPGNMDFFSIALNDYYLIMRLFTKEGTMDSEYVLCSNPSSLEWGKRLYDHYLKDSKPITKV